MASKVPGIIGFSVIGEGCLASERGQETHLGHVFVLREGPCQGLPQKGDVLDRCERDLGEKIVAPAHTVCEAWAVCSSSPGVSRVLRVEF